MADKLPVWANNDLATYSAFQGLPSDITKSAPTTIDPQNPNAKGNPKGVEVVPGGNESDPNTFRVPVSTPSGWDPTVKLYANYDSTGSLTGYSGSNPVFPADANGNLSKLKYTPMWDASGKSASVQDTSHGGWAGTPLVMAAASMIPGAAPVIAGLNAVNSLANGKLDTSTILNGITAAAGLGNRLGFDPSTISDLSAAKNVASGINAVQKGNIAGVISSLNSLKDILPADTPQAVNIINGIAALKKGDTAGALSALSSLTGSPDIKVASQATNIIKSLTSNGQTPIQSGIATPAAQTTGSAPSVLQGIASPQTEVTAGQMIDQNIFGLVNPYTQFNEAQKTALAKGLPSLLGG